MTLYTTQKAPKGKDSQYTPEVVAKIKEIAGEYFMGDIIGEIGTNYGARPKGYGQMMKDGLDDLADCRDYFLQAIKKHVDIDRNLGIPNIISPTAVKIPR